MRTGRCTTITPIVPTVDFERALQFYMRVLGFTVQARQDDYAYLIRDEVAIRLLAKKEPGKLPEQSCYICVENLQELYEEFKPRLDKLPEGRVKAPFVQPYGQREFHVIDEDSLLIFFGEPA